MHGQTFCLIFAAITSQVKKKKIVPFIPETRLFFGFFFQKYGSLKLTDVL